MRVSFKNAQTGEAREVKVGWSWTLFLFSGFFGLPLFLRKLNVWGFVILALWVVNFIATNIIVGPQGMFATSLMFFIFVGLQIWLGVKGNEMTAKNYLEQGWAFVEPQSDNVRFARGKWGLSA